MSTEAEGRQPKSEPKRPAVVKIGPVARQAEETARRAKKLGGTSVYDLPAVELPTSTPTTGASS
ncbi:MAG TPA: hypothetical protein VN711_01465 [Candidatus Saccharimonadales bacterium]|nr:hypothetical protein [Candidatus Saccharimonadales bacterium]